MLIYYIVRLLFFIKNKSPAIATQLAAIRYAHVLAGYPDFTIPGRRYRTLIRSMRPGVPPNRKLPPNLDLARLIQKFYGDYRTSDLGVKRIWSFIVISFYARPMEEEKRKLRHRDIRFHFDEGAIYVTIFTTTAKTGRCEQGAFRTLREAHGTVFPVETLLDSVGSFNRGSSFAVVFIRRRYYW